MAEPQPLKITTIHQISEDDFSSLVVEVYGRPYQLQQDGPYGDTMGNGETFSFTVPDDAGDYVYDKCPTLEEWSTRDVNTPPEGVIWNHDFERRLWWTREYHPPFGDIADDLHRRGLLPAGDYQMLVEW